MECLTIDPKTVDLDALIERGTNVHGHLGPFLVAGFVSDSWRSNCSTAPGTSESVPSRIPVRPLRFRV